MRSVVVSENVWFRAPPEAALERLPDRPGSGSGFLIALRLADGTIRVGYGTNPRVRLASAFAEGKKNPDKAVVECLFSIPHREPWKTEFAIHNRLAPDRVFGDIFRTDLDRVVEILNQQALTPAGDEKPSKGPALPGVSD